MRVASDRENETDDKREKLMAVPDDVDAIKSSWVTDRASLASEKLANAELVDANALIARELVAAKLEIVRLQAIIDDEPDVPPPGAPLVGCNTDGTGLSWDQLVAKTGPLDVRRAFETGVPSSFMTKCAQDVTRKNAVVWSIKTGATFNRDAILALLKTIPSTMRVFLADQHEPEDNLSPAQFKALQAALRPVVDEANVGRTVPIAFGGIFMSSAAPGNGTKYNMADYYPGAGVWDFLGWDVYNKSTGSGRRTASQIMTNCFKLNSQFKLPFMVAELGDITEAQRAAWISEAYVYCKANKAIAMIYYNTDTVDSSGVTYTYGLDTTAEFKALGDNAIA